MKFYPQPYAVPKTGDNTPSRSIWGYIVRMTGRHQIFACLLALAVAGVDIIPIDLQRRLIDHAIKERDLSLFAVLAAVYFGVVVLHKILKFVLSVYQNWMTESAVLYTRAHIFGLYGHHLAEAADSRDSGTVVSIIGSETDKIGEFVGTAISEAAVNVTVMIGVLTYMLVVDWRIALIGLALLIPQIVLTPLVQRKLNRLVAVNVGLLRALGRDVSHLGLEGGPAPRSLWRTIYRNRMIQSAIRNGLKSGLNLLNGLAPLAVLVIGGYQVMQGQTTIGIILAFISGFDRVSEPIRNLITFYRNAQQANVQHAMIARWMVNDMQVGLRRPRITEAMVKEDVASVEK
jgi:ABC-type bacteriocin/lantibiotic exporter with double-glycine peptidase domain